MMQTKMATMMTSTITLPAHGSLIAGQGIVLFDLPIGSVDHADDDSGHNQDSDQTSHSGADVQRGGGGHQGADGVDQVGHRVACAQLQADAGPDPLAALHLGVHGADGGEARRCIQVEHEVSQGGDFGDGDDAGNLSARALQHRQLIGVNQVLQTHEADGQGAHHVLLGDEAGDGGGGQLPAEDAHDGHQQIGEGAGDGGQDGGVRCLCHLEAPVEGLHHLHHGVAQQDDGGGLFDVSPAAVAHGLKGAPQGGGLVFRQLHDEEGLSGLVAGDLVHQQSAQEDQNDAGGIHHEAHPAGSVEESAGKQRDHGDLCAAGHEGGEHGGGPALPVVADGTAGHDAGDSAAGGDDKGNDGLAGQTHLLEDGVQHHGGTGHVAAVLQQGDQEVHDHDQRQEADNVLLKYVNH